MAEKKTSRSGGRKAHDKDFVQLALDAGALNAKVVSPSSVETAEWVRWKCQFGCDGFGSNRLCPPHSPTPDKTRLLLDGYKRALLFETPIGKTTAIAANLERTLFLAGHYKAFGLGAGPCQLCPQCAFEKGCRHAGEARPAMEACGIDVYATARNNGFTINVVRDFSDPQHYFGLILID